MVQRVKPMLQVTAVHVASSAQRHHTLAQSPENFPPKPAPPSSQHCSVRENARASLLLLIQGIERISFQHRLSLKKLSSRQLISVIVSFRTCELQLFLSEVENVELWVGKILYEYNIFIQQNVKTNLDNLNFQNLRKYVICSVQPYWRSQHLATVRSPKLETLGTDNN